MDISRLLPLLHLLNLQQNPLFLIVPFINFKGTEPNGIIGFQMCICNGGHKSIIPFTTVDPLLTNTV